MPEMDWIAVSSSAGESTENKHHLLVHISLSPWNENGSKRSNILEKLSMKDSFMYIDTFDA